jgi:hypothetical protein
VKLYTDSGPLSRPRFEFLFRVIFILCVLSRGSGLQLRAVAADEISPNALNEIRALLDEKASWSPAQAKMDSQLIHAAKRQRGQPFAAGAPNLRFDVTLQPDGRVLVDINAEVTPELLALLVHGGGTVIRSVPEFNSIRALVSPAQLETIAASPAVKSIRRAARFHTNTGSVDSQGDTTHLAAAARAAFGVNGTGIKVGVLSDSVDFLTNSQATGDLGPVTVLPGQSGVPATGEGTAMLEIIHDLAPGAQLFFATADGGEAGFAQNIIALRANGCDIIVDDVGYFDESPFQDGIIAQAVNTVTTGGALYFSSAGNSGNLDSGTSGTWEGDFVDGGAAASPISEAGRLHSFGSYNYNVVTAAGLSIDLFWADPLGASTNDYDLFLLNAAGTSVVASSMTRQTGSSDPYESIGSFSPGERIVIVKFSGSPRFLHLDTQRGGLGIPTPGATLGHSSATNAFSVAAIDIAKAYPNPFTGGPTNPVETFSSDGPRHVFFNADGTPITPGNFSSTGGAVRQKPDLTAADGVATSVTGFASFFGTSAAAPHAASIAALLKSYNPLLSPAQMRAVLTGTTLDNMAAGVDRDSGFGIVMANTALAAAPPDALFLLPGAGFAATGPAGGPFNPASLNFTLTNNGSNTFTWSLVNTSAWLSISPVSSSLTSGAPAITVSASLNVAATNLAAGTYTATVWFTNQAGNLGQSRLFTLSVTQPPAASTYASAVLALNPIAYWRLSETNQPPPAGVATNSGSLGQVANGFDFSGVQTFQSGIVGASYRFFNPSLLVGFLGSHVDIPYNAALNPAGPFTIELWVKPAQLTPDLFCPAASLDTSQNGGNSRMGWLFYQSSGATWQFRIGNLAGYTATLTGGTVQSNAWHHLAGVYDGTNVSLYVNGARVAGPTAGNFVPNGSAAFRLGATTIPNRTFDGWVDEVAFYTNALGSNVIAAHYAAVTTNNAGYGAQVLASSPVGYWHLDEPAITNSGTLPVALNIGSLAPNANGTYQPGTLPGAAGVPNAGFGAGNIACLFNGAGFIDVPPTFLDLFGPVTLLAWIKPAPANGSLQSIISRGGASYRLFMDGAGHPRFANGAQPGGDVTSTNRIDDGQWHQLAGVYDGTNSEYLYVDGLLAASATNATALVSGNANDLWIGGDPDSGAFQLFNGVIDEPAIFTNVLSAAQVQQLFVSAGSAPASSPVFTNIAANAAGNPTLTLTWTTTVGRSYQLQYKTDLTQTNWTTLTNLTATLSTATAADGPNTDPQRFYRVVLLP